MAKALLKEALSGSKFAVEAIDTSDTAHITFQKVHFKFDWLRRAQLWSVLHYPASNHWHDIILVAKLQAVSSSVHSVWFCNKVCGVLSTVASFTYTICIAQEGPALLSGDADI